MDMNLICFSMIVRRLAKGHILCCEFLFDDLSLFGGGSLRHLSHANTFANNLSLFHLQLALTQ